MAVVRKRQDDTNLKILRELVTSGGGNRQCFDCGQKGPTYVNMTIGSFVCTRCSGVLRGLTPPHRVKSISVATFTPDEIEFLKAHGNDVCAKTWLGLWDPKRIVHQDQRELMIDKYERKRYYLEPASPLKSLTNTTKVSSLSSSNNSISTNASGNGISNNNNNNNNSSNSSNKSSTDCSLKSVALTPPTSLRLTANGIVNSSNRQNRYNLRTDDNSNKRIFLANGVGIVNQIANKNSLNVSTSSNSSQSFTPDSDFVADFSTANIFNATSQNAPNGFKNHQITNGFQGKTFLNGEDSSNHTGLTHASNVNENFADFDHAPIYNAAGLPMSKSSMNSVSSNVAINSNSSVNLTPPADRYAALKDLDEQLRESKVAAVDTFSSNAQQAQSSTVNPFKTNPPSQPQQTMNPFQTSYNQSNSFFGTQNQNNTTNAFGTNATFNVQPISSFNGYSTQTTMVTNGSNNCGLGYGAQPITAGNAVTNVKNPFATSSLNSNNPFL